jgi:integrase
MGGEKDQSGVWRNLRGLQSHRTEGSARNEHPRGTAFPSSRTIGQHYKSVKGIWRTSLRKARISYFRIYDLRSTYATRLSAGGVADEWVVQLLRQGNSDVFKKYSQMKLAMKREALKQLNRRANEMTLDEPQTVAEQGFGTVLVQ